MVRQINLDLSAWGDWHIRNIDFSGYSNIEAVERYFFSPGRANGVSGHKILCPEMPRRLQEVERAVAQLSGSEQWAVTFKYCAPLRSDGVVHTNSELASKLGISRSAFEQRLCRGRNNVEKIIYGSEKKIA